MDRATLGGSDGGEIIAKAGLAAGHDEPAVASRQLLDTHNVRIEGRGAVTLVLAHGYGCDQSMWRALLREFRDEFRTVAFDFVGCGGSTAPYDRERYAGLPGYAADLAQICRAAGGGPFVFVGHSVAAMVGALAAIRDPGLFRAMVMIGPSPCYLTDGDYPGGFTRQDIEALLALMDADDGGWATTLASTVMGNPDRPELTADLAASFCRMTPAVARQFARVTFLADNRDDLARVAVPVLVLQCRDDAIAPVAVGEYVHRQLSGSRFVVLDASGHCPHVSAPAETAAAIRSFLAELAPLSAG